MRSVIVVIASLLVGGGSAFAGDAPATYERCKKCHGTPGQWWSETVGPRLEKTKYTFEQFYNQVTYGSRWEGKPKRAFAYRSREMPMQVGLSDDEIRALYDWLATLRE